MTTDAPDYRQVGQSGQVDFCYQNSYNYIGTLRSLRMAKMVEATVVTNERHEFFGAGAVGGYHGLMVKVVIGKKRIEAGLREGRILQTLLTEHAIFVKGGYGGREVGSVASYLVPKNFIKIARKELKKLRKQS